jgi:hypothetical protein
LVDDFLALTEQSTNDTLTEFFAEHPLAKDPVCPPTVLQDIAEAICEIATVWTWPL